MCGLKWPSFHYHYWRGWPDKALTAAGLFGEFWQQNHFFGKRPSCQNTHSFFLTPYAQTHVNTRTFHLLTPHNGMTVSAAGIKQASANRPAELIVTQHRGTQALSRVQPPTNFAMQRESADEVCQHALLSPNSQKTTGNQCAPAYGWRGRGDKRGGMTFQKYLGWIQAQPVEHLSAMRAAFLLTL